jgi:hypothetical protein
LSRLAGGDQELFGEIEAPALRQFNQLQGNIASRFSGGLGQGGFGARRSSGFQNAMSSEASNLAQSLQAQRQDLQRQAIRDLMSLSNTLLNQRPFQRFLTQKQQKPSFLSRILGGAAPIVGAIGGGLLGGPSGAALGSSIGGAFGSAFGGREAGPIDVSSFSSLFDEDESPTTTPSFGPSASSFGLPNFLGR